MSTTILDPTAASRAARTHSSPAPPVVDAIGGLRVGLLENTKRNASEVLDAVGGRLVVAHGAGELVRRTKPQFAMPLTAQQIEDLVASCDVVVVGVGDCGSCSASAVADGIALQRAGLAAAVICTDAFAGPSRAMADMQGDPDFPFLTIPHPIANLAGDEIAARADGIAAEIVRAVTGPTG